MPRAVPIVVALLALQAALVLLFVVPTRSPEPHGLPVGVVGPGPALPGEQFEVHRYADTAAARTAIREREVYGAIVPAEGRVLVASAASLRWPTTRCGRRSRPCRRGNASRSCTVTCSIGATTRSRT